MAYPSCSISFVHPCPNSWRTHTQGICSIFFSIIFFTTAFTSLLLIRRSNRFFVIDDDAFATKNMTLSLPLLPFLYHRMMRYSIIFFLFSFFFSEPNCVGFFDWFGFDCFSWSCSLWAETDHGVRFWLLSMCIRLVIERKNALCWMQRKKRSILYVYIFFLLLIIALIFFFDA